MKKGLLYITTMLLLVGFSNPATVLGMGSPEDVQIHGFISQGLLYSDEYNYLAHNSTDGSFEYNEIGINFSKQMTDKLRVGLQLFSRDLGDVANNKVTLDWAYGEYRFKDWLGIRGGRIKRPVALYTEIRDVDLLRTSIVLPQSIYHDLNRDSLIAMNGVGLFGNVDMKAAGNFDYQMLVGTSNLDNESGLKKFWDNGLGGMGEISGETTADTGYAGQLIWNTPLPGLRLAYQYNDQSVTLDIDLGLPSTVASEADSTFQTFSLEQTWENLIVAAEYHLADFETTTLGMTNETTLEGYYLSASYRFTDLFSLGAYYSVYYPDNDDKDGDAQVALGRPDYNAWQKDLAVSLRFDINDYLIFKLEGHHVNGTAGVIGIDNPTSDFGEEDWYYGAAKMTFSF